jgi:hypothetical protein
LNAIVATERFPMKNEQRLLNLICLIGALGLFAFVAYNLFAAGAVISTDGLFFTVVPTVIAICFLAVPLQPVVSRRIAKLLGTAGETGTPIAAGARPAVGGAAVSGVGAAATLRTAPALKDPKGRALPPDVNRMVAEMSRTEGSKQ